ncbi:MAG: sulfur carrier protein ThiS [Moraxellaceae bacterium]
MIIALNGQSYDTQAQSLAELVTELQLSGKRIAIEVDQQLIPKSQHATTPLRPQLHIEIVHAVGGG